MVMGLEAQMGLIIIKKVRKIKSDKNMEYLNN